jgi:AcrR family transcriptional regulator
VILDRLSGLLNQNRTIVLLLSRVEEKVSTHPGTPAKRVYDPEGTRRRILDVAAAEFQTRGYNATSMHDVQRLASAPGGSLYHHFPTKKSLALAVITERVAPEVEATWIEPVRSAANALDGVVSVFEQVANDIDGMKRQVLGCPLNNLALELALADADFQFAVRSVFEAWGSAIAERLGDDTATLVVAAFSGAMSLAKAEQSVEPLRRCARELSSLLRERAQASPG